MVNSGLAPGSMTPTLYQACRYNTILLFSYKRTL